MAKGTGGGGGGGGGPRTGALGQSPAGPLTGAMNAAQQRYRGGLIDRHLDNEAFREEIRQTQSQNAQELGRTTRQQRRAQNR